MGKSGFSYILTEKCDYVRVRLSFYFFLLSPTLLNKTATVCRGYFYPLYVSEVLDKWPEDGRHRQIVSIDEAIKAVVRPELKLVLQEVKDKKLHLVGPCK